MKLRTIKLKSLMIGVICTSLLWLPVGASSSSVIVADQLTRSLVDTQAAKYTRAVSELSNLANLPLTTESEFQKAVSVMKEQTDNLRFVKYRMVQIALSNSTFVSSVQTELAKSVGQEDQLLKEFHRTPATLTNLNGARAAQQGISAELGRGLQQVKRASQHIRNAADLILKRRGSVSVTNQVAYVNVGYNQGGNVHQYFEALFTATTLIATSVRAPSKLRVGSGGRGSGGSGSGSGGVASWTTDEDEYHACANQISGERTRCEGKCDPGFFQWTCLANCAAVFMLAKAECIINSTHPD